MHYAYRMYNIGTELCMLGRFQHASDAAYEKYRCPVFKGFVVCVSGMASDDRNGVRTLVEQNGQQYICVFFIHVLFYCRETFRNRVCSTRISVV